MATATRRHSIVNPARRRNRAKARRRNKSRRHMTAKQIKFFGTAAQRAGLKRKRKNSAKKNRRRHHVTAKRHNRRTVARAAPKRRVNRARRATPRAKKRRSNRRRSNPGEILSLTLGNPARKRRGMARHAKKHNRRRATASGSRRHNRRRRNPSVRHHRYSHRRNPAGFNITSLFTEGLGALAGLVGSRLLTQAVLGASNTGFYGYAGNAAATAVLATLAHMLFKTKPAIRDGVVIGGTVGILARAMQDYTPFGTYLAGSGFGDYAGGGAHGVGVYLPWNGVTPQRYVDALNSAQVQIPSGWAPTVSVPAKTGVGALYSGGMSLY